MENCPECGLPMTEVFVGNQMSDATVGSETEAVCFSCAFKKVQKDEAKGLLPRADPAWPKFMPEGSFYPGPPVLDLQPIYDRLSALEKENAELRKEMAQLRGQLTKLRQANLRR